MGKSKEMNGFAEILKNVINKNEVTQIFLFLCNT